MKTRRADVKLPPALVPTVNPPSAVTTPKRVEAPQFSVGARAATPVLTGEIASAAPVPQRDPFAGQVAVTRDYDPHHRGIIDGDFIATKTEVLAAAPTPDEVWTGIKGAEQSGERGEYLLFEPFPGSVVGNVNVRDRSLLEKLGHAFSTHSARENIARSLDGIVGQQPVMFHVARGTVRAFPPLDEGQQRAFAADVPLRQELAGFAREHGVFSFVATRGADGALQVSEPIPPTH